MPVTYTKLEEFTGTRTTSAADPENEGETIETTVDCRDIQVRFTDGTIVHERSVNVSFDADGNYDEAATDNVLNQHCRGVENKIAVGVIS